MAKKTFSKNAWVLFLLMLTGIVLGSFLGYITRDAAAFSWLNYGIDFGIGSANSQGVTTLNLGVIVLTFGLSIRISIASIIGMILSIFIYRKM